jgi:Concanavalin A-like lectin/glucanases superfamily
MNSRTVSLGLALASFILARQASATVTAQAWFHFGEGGVAVQTDSTTNNNSFNAAYFQCTAPLPGGNAAGGPLGDSGYTSTSSSRFGLNGCVTELYRSGTLNPATTNYFVPPPTNFGAEIWYFPQNKGYVSDGTQAPFTPIFATGGSIFGAGPGGGVAVVVSDNLDGTSSLQAAVVHQGDSAGAYAFFGPSILMDTNHWIHLALVETDGTLVFYTNGVPCATNDDIANPQTASAGTMFIGRDGGHVSVDGYLDEFRIFTFASGAFSVSDLLYGPSPRNIAQPLSTADWNGGAANILADISTDPANTFQWYRGTNLLVGQTSANLNLNTVALTDSGGLYDCAVTNDGIGLVTSNATLTVVAVQTANVAAYQNAVTSEPSLLAYFTVDGSTTATVVNTVDALHNGTLELGALYDGQTNRAFGSRALYLTGASDVQIPSDTAYEFAGGNGTIEALVYLEQTANGNNAPIFSIASSDGTATRYSFGASGDGTSLYCTNDSGVSLTWPVGANLLNRLAHVALVFSGGSSVTAYLDGNSLGGKTQAGFGSATGVPAWIGSDSSNNPVFWNGTIDEVAVYGSALSASTIAVHNSKFVFGTNASAPSIVSQSRSKTLYAGGSPVLSVSVAGTPPLSYQWLSNGVAISGATGSTLSLTRVPTNATAAYTITVSNPLGSTNNHATPINLHVITPPDVYAAAVMADNPSAYWRLDEGSGTNMTDYAGELDGGYSGTLTLGAAGIIASDSAVSFGGGLGSVPFSSILNPAGPFTVEFWAKPADTAAHTAISSQFRSGSARLGYICYDHFDGSGWEFEMGNPGGIGVDLIGATPVVAGNWYHVAMTYDGGSNATLYVFGYADAASTTVGSGGYIPNASAAFQIGQRNQGAFPFNGTLDEVTYFGYALTQAQLQNHLGIGLPIKLAIAPSATVVADSKPSGLPFNGFNNGAAWLASDSDGTTTRAGVMHFTAIANTNNLDQVYVPAYGNLLTTNGTIMFWVHPGTNVPSSGYNQGSGSAPLLQWRNNNGGCGFYINDNGTLFVQAMNNYDHFDSTGSISDGKWHHVAFTYDQSPLGGITCFIDGVQDSAGGNSQGWFWTPTALIELGQDFNDAYWENYNGTMDDVRMYGRILSQSEIQSAMTGAVVDASTLNLRLDFATPPGGYAVSWPYGKLQTAPGVTGSYTTISNLSSPYPVAPAAAPQSFYRALR